MFRTALVTAALGLCFPLLGLAQSVDELVARNVEARGGAAAWRAVTSVRFTGSMDVGRGLRVPYVLEQKAPRKMRLEFTFEGETAVQSSDGKTGWTVVPFRGQNVPTPMTEQQLLEAGDSAGIYGLLIDYAARGHAVELVGTEPLSGRDAFKLKVTLPGGAVRWVYLDAESGLEVKVEALRTVAGRSQRVETLFYDWQPAGGVLISRRHEMKAGGVTETHVLTVETVQVNPDLEDSRFALPTNSQAGRVR